jgi:hypothetical protein
MPLSDHGATSLGFLAFAARRGVRASLVPMNPSLT